MTHQVSSMPRMKDPLDLSKRLRWYTGLFQAILDSLEAVYGKVVAISYLYLVYDVILHLLGAQW